MEILIYQHNSNLSFDDYQSALTGLISESCPNLVVDFQPVDLALGDFLEGWLTGQHDEDPFYHFENIAYGTSNAPPQSRLLTDIGEVTLTMKDKLKNYAKLSHAGWGFCSNDFLAFNYAPPEFRIRNLVHESLHLFSVNDCYDKDLKSKSSCDNPKCIMRYGQSAVSIEICSSVKNQLKSI